ncbi:calcium-activated chloride channel regulator 3A-1-like [Dendropsophus ebraccatus]|uniref:calcium-activated chloride channel regulator 3A-1-like n=1 Tax=Dendropsophus ebraccatus TaxID=150705 RepID=UPI0038321E86
MRNTFRFILLLHLVSVTVTSFIRLNNGSYEDIVIAINPALREDVGLIEKIKEMVKDASMYLFNATEKRLSIGNVRILIPSNWTANNYKARTTETYEKADIIISNPNKKYGDSPYTVQYRGCGEPGEYINLTPNYLLNTSLSSVYGPPGRTFVHEWAHLRWGVFDEYNTEIPYYISGELKVEATRCSVSLKGSDVIEECQEDSCSFRDCNIDPYTGLYEQGCLFLPEKVQNVQESIMYSAAFPSITSFCNDSNHNVEAPSPQNQICNGRSTWDVIMSSTDIMSTPPRSDADLPGPTFTLLQDKRRVITLACDISGSMDNYNRIGRLHQAAEFFLSQLVEIGTYVGMVEFGTLAFPLSNLVRIKGEEDRAKLISAIPSTTIKDVGDICQGILEALKVNKKLDGSAVGTEIVLASDGETNFAKCIREVSASGAIIHTISLGSEASMELQQIADMTGGQKHYITDKSIGNDLLHAFSAISSQNGDVSEQSILLESRSLDIVPGGCVNSTVFIDATVGTSTFFLVTWQTTVPSIHLQDPNGNTYTEAQFANNTISNSSRLQIPGKAETGAWIYTICNSLKTNQAVGMIVTSKAAADNVAPITITAHMNKDTNDYPDPMIIYTSVRQDLLPVTNLHVTAIVEAESGRSVTVELLDNGAGADIFRNDGVYSRYFTSFSGNGRYNLKVQVESQEEENRLALPRNSALYIPGYVEDGRTSLNPPRSSVNAADLRITVGHISRTASGGTFMVNKVPASPPTITHKPSKITDLEANVQGNSIILSWTASGGDLDQGRAARYDLRMSTNPRYLRDNFTHSAPIDISSLTPQLFGSREQFTFQPSSIAAQHGMVLFFAMSAIGQDNQESDVSNIAQTVVFNSTTPETSTTTDSTTLLTSYTVPSSSPSSVSKISTTEDKPPFTGTTMPPTGSPSSPTPNTNQPNPGTGTSNVTPTYSTMLPTDNTLSPGSGKVPSVSISSTTDNKPPFTETTMPPTGSPSSPTPNTNQPNPGTGTSNVTPTYSTMLPTDNTLSPGSGKVPSVSISPTTDNKPPFTGTTVPPTGSPTSTLSIFSQTIPPSNLTQPPDGQTPTTTDSSVTRTDTTAGQSDSTKTPLTNSTITVPQVTTSNSSPTNINVTVVVVVVCVAAIIVFIAICLTVYFTRYVKRGSYSSTLA